MRAWEGGQLLVPGCCVIATGWEALARLCEIWIRASRERKRTLL